MEYSSLGTLESELRDNWKNGMEDAIAKRYFGQICTGMRHLHKNGIAHRDLKLDNVLLFPSVLNHKNFICKITDFEVTDRAYNEGLGFRKDSALLYDNTDGLVGLRGHYYCHFNYEFKIY